MPNNITNELTCEKPETLASLAGLEANQFVDFNRVVPMPEILRGDVDEDTKDWAEIALGVVNLSTLRKSHGNPADSFRAGDYGAAADSLKQGSVLRMLTKGPFPKDYDDKRFEQLINCMRCLKQYGHTSWYEWSIANWGTKWNAYDQERISETVVRFDTAWNAPLKVLDALSLQHPQEAFRLRWADEDFGSNVGDVTVKNGELISGGPIENDSKEAHALALELVHGGEVPEEYEWKDGKLVYLESA